MSVDVYSLPPDLPVPEDDGACEGLVGVAVPAVVLPSSQGPVDLAGLARDRLVLYIYPRSGRPDVPLLPGWNEIPGARGCTPQSCAFRDHAVAASAGLERASRDCRPRASTIRSSSRRASHIAVPVVSDEGLVLRDALGLPTFETAGLTLYKKRVTIVAEEGLVAKVFYPVFPPDRQCGGGRRVAVGEVSR